jgi:micrococcal nuclease
MNRFVTSFILILIPLICYSSNVVVKKIIDGDTFQTDAEETVRLIGINAPEISDIFGREAKNHLSNLILGKVVYLGLDEISKERDQYNRLLRYVMLDTIDINKKMIDDGFAFAYLKYKFNKSGEYERSQIYASQNNFGIWENTKDQNPTTLKPSENINKGISPKLIVLSISILLLIIIGFYYNM